MGGPERVLLMLPLTVALYGIESENNKDWGLINYSIWKQEYICEGMMIQNKTNQTLRLKDGRTLGFAEYGDPQGKPIFEFHGNPSSRLGSGLFDETAMKLGIRVIGIDRPGMGLSDYKPHRKILDWPGDVIELADALGFGKFPIVGGSGGVPATLACAYKIPERLSAVGVLFGPRPIDSPGATDGWSRTRRVQVYLERNGPFWVTSMWNVLKAKS